MDGFSYSSAGALLEDLKDILMVKISCICSLKINSDLINQSLYKWIPRSADTNLCAFGITSEITQFCKGSLVFLMSRFSLIFSYLSIVNWEVGVPVNTDLSNLQLTQLTCEMKIAESHRSVCPESLDFASLLPLPMEGSYIF